MDALVQHLAHGLVEKLKELPQDQRYLVGLCGIPGSGKSVLASAVVKAINTTISKQAEHDAQGNVATVVGMDGWHLTRAQLAQMPDPQLAKDRRGSEWTFDAKGFADFMQALRTPMSQLSSAGADRDGMLWAPSFSHALKDPVDKDIRISPQNRLIIVEGLYANLNTGEWARASKTYDERWLIDVEEDAARQRLLDRHVDSGVANDLKEAAWRADNNDMPNGRFLLSHLQEPIVRLQSTPDQTWVASQQ
ncbi:hypothetical protein OC846_005520 [Tilletia horrida]|uniref:Phosphoribulokinase/uridine kinase domain-containing protein n=1 Tax=Tilletia horrida TaxID=155126 RepID=A0AAN6GL47_9BASI|nr:hypothetical protein OC846_005520 [Tilletia horrida]